MAGSVAIQIILAVLGSGGLITAFAALRKTKVEGNQVTMSTLNERLNSDNLLLRAEVNQLRVEVSSLRTRVTELEHALAEATK